MEYRSLRTVSEGINAAAGRRRRYVSVRHSCQSSDAFQSVMVNCQPNRVNIPYDNFNDVFARYSSLGMLFKFRCNTYHVRTRSLQPFSSSALVGI